MFLLHHFLENSAKKFPKKTAVEEVGGRSIDYSQLNFKSNSFAEYIISKSNYGDRIGIILKNNIKYIIAYFGILKSGRVAVPLNPELDMLMLKYIINDCKIKGLVCNYPFTKEKFEGYYECLNFIIDISEETETSNTICTGFPASTIKFSKIIESKLQVRSYVEIIDSDIASIYYTSGSTGKPKGVTLTHLNIVTNTKSIVKYLNLNSKSSVLVVLPMYYCYGASLIHTHFFVGGGVVFENRFTFPGVILDSIENYHVTGFSGVPSTFNILINRTNFLNRNYKYLKYLTQAGGGMAPLVIEKITNSIKGVKLFVMYGATEASARLSYLEPDKIMSKLGSIGKAIPNVKLGIIKDEFSFAKPYEEGEIVAKGSNIMIGYWNDKKETENVVRHGYYLTGDLGYKDNDGYFYITGRKKEMIKVAGYRVSSKEIEEFLIKSDLIEEVAVIGIEDDISGEVPMAFIKKNSINNENDYLLDQLHEKCMNNLPSYKRPKYFKIVDDLPKNSSGKIIKKRLKP